MSEISTSDSFAGARMKSEGWVAGTRLDELSFGIPFVSVSLNDDLSDGTTPGGVDERSTPC